MIQIDNNGQNTLDEEGKPIMNDVMLGDDGKVVLDGNGYPKVINNN